MAALCQTPPAEDEDLRAPKGRDRLERHTCQMSSSGQSQFLPRRISILTYSSLDLLTPISIIPTDISLSAPSFLLFPIPPSLHFHLYIFSSRPPSQWLPLIFILIFPLHSLPPYFFPSPQPFLRQELSVSDTKD
jgi:hypothetical protein